MCFTAALAAMADTVQANSGAEIQGLIDGATGERTVLLPVGTVSLPQGLTLKSNVTLDGRGMSTLAFQSAVGTRGLQAYGTKTLIGTVASVDLGLRTVTLNQAVGLADGDMLYMDAGNGLDGTVGTVSGDVNGGPTIALADDVNQWAVGKPVYRVTPVTNVSVQNLTITGTYNPFWFEEVSHVSLSRVIMLNGTLNSIFFRSRDVSVSDSVLDNVGGGFSFLATTGASARRNTVVKHRMSAFFFRSVNRGEALGNIVSGNPDPTAQQNGDGVTVNRSNQLRIWENDIRYPAGYGVSIEASRNCSLERNWVTASPVSSYYISASDSVSLLKNVATTNQTGFGFTMINSQFLYSSGNTAYQVLRGFHMVNNWRSGSGTDNLSLGNQAGDYFVGNSN